MQKNVLNIKNAETLKKLLCLNLIFIVLIYSAFTHSKENIMSAVGSFEVEIVPQTDDEIDAGRMILKKTFIGDLKGIAKGQMLSKRTSVDTSAAYVAIETYTGTVNGLSGSFAMYHVGLMVNGMSSLSVNIVPDSGTEELTGISGTMEIIIADGKHSYNLTYDVQK